jgi:hypothetical protein
MDPHAYQLSALLILVLFVPLSRWQRSLWVSCFYAIFAAVAWAYLGFSVLLPWFDRTGRAQSEKGFAIWCIIVFGGVALIAFIADLPQKVESYRNRLQRRRDRARQAGAHLANQGSKRLSAEEISQKLRKLAEEDAAPTLSDPDAPSISRTRPLTSAEAEALKDEITQLKNETHGLREEIARKDRLIAQLTESLMQQKGTLPGA